MKRFNMSLVLLIVISLIISCSETTSPTVENNLILVSSLSKTMITSSAKLKSDNIQADIDSIKVESIRILLSNIKAKLADAERVVDAGPVVFRIADTNNTVEFASADLPASAMDKIKFEIHRFSTSELSNYVNNNIFKDFATTERHTIIINGKMKSASAWESFEYKTDIVGNLNYDFNPPINLKDNIKTIVEFCFQSDSVFKENGVIVDPTNPTRKNHIDNQIKNAITAKYK